MLVAITLHNNIYLLIVCLYSSGYAYEVFAVYTSTAAAAVMHAADSTYSAIRAKEGDVEGAMYS